jgi:hypothetical protein
MLTEPFLDKLRHTEASTYGTTYHQQRESLWKTRAKRDKTQLRRQSYGRGWHPRAALIGW